VIPMDTRPVLIVTASMGAGHVRAAQRLSAGLSARYPCRTVDLLDLLPARLGPALRSGYAAMMRGAPWLYQGIFQTFFVSHGRWQPSTSPLAALAAPRLLRLVAECDPRAVVSTFHVAGQVAGRLRRQRLLSVPSVVAVTEPAAHLLWCDRGTDLFLCPYPWVATEVRRRAHRPTSTPGPLVDDAFLDVRATTPAGTVAALRAELGLAANEHAVLISGGSWGVGSLGRTVRALTRAGNVRAVVLCGRNERLRSRLAATEPCIALGWRDDLPALFSVASALVDNAGGTTCAEAFAAGLPVIGADPIAGHGRIGQDALIRAGLVADGQHDLLGAVTAACAPGTALARQCCRARAMFRADPAQRLADWIELGAGDHAPAAAQGAGPAWR
jgi:UDP-N-acetylglucosamine:LPS N-acetylglucosamine transferase